MGKSEEYVVARVRVLFLDIGKDYSSSLAVQIGHRRAHSPNNERVYLKRVPKGDTEISIS